MLDADTDYLLEQTAAAEVELDPELCRKISSSLRNLCRKKDPVLLASRYTRELLSSIIRDVLPHALTIAPEEIIPELQLEIQGSFGLGSAEGGDAKGQSGEKNDRSSAAYTWDNARPAASGTRMAAQG